MNVSIKTEQVFTDTENKFSMSITREDVKIIYAVFTANNGNKVEAIKAIRYMYHAANNEHMPLVSAKRLVGYLIDNRPQMAELFNIKVPLTTDEVNQMVTEEPVHDMGTDKAAEAETQCDCEFCKAEAEGVHPLSILVAALNGARPTN